MKKSLIIVVIAVLVLGTAFVFVDESLTPETKAWLETPLALPDNTRGRALVKAFEEIAVEESGSLVNQSQQVSKEIIQACMPNVGQSCIELLVSSPVDRRKYLPQDPRYYERFAAILEESVLSTHPSQLFSVPWQNLTIAPRHVFLNSLVEQGRVDPLLLAKSLEFSRRMMKDASYMNEKVIFASMFGRSIAAANMAMGLRHLTVEEVLSNADLDRLLAPLDKNERSYARVMMGEVRFANHTFEHVFTGSAKFIVNMKRNTLLNRQQILMQPVIEYSEHPIETFWITELGKPTPSWKDYLTGNAVDSIVKITGEFVRVTQHLDLQLAVLRAMRRVYRGVSPYNHGEPAPPSFSWKWHPESDELCLFATDHDQSDPDRTPTKIDGLGANGVCMVRF